MAGYVITVDFAIDPARYGEFLQLMRENAAASLRDEAGCRHFDVCTARDGAPRIFLYEIYDDEAAFKLHLETAHYKAFAAAIRDMVRERKIVAYDLLDDPTAAVLGALPGE